MTLYNKISTINNTRDTDRFIELHAFLHQAGITDFILQPLAQDASKRCYFRVQTTKGAQILMDSSLEPESFNRFVQWSEYLRRNNINVPAIICHNASGYALLEDFGQTSINQYIANNPARRKKIYQKMIDLLVQWQGLPKESFMPLYDVESLDRELQQFLQYYVKSHLEPALFIEAEKELLSIFHVLYKGIKNQYDTVVHKDFHVDNLMAVNGDANTIGILDFQDACLGSAAYDVVSLLQDARCLVPAELESAMIEYYLDATGNTDIESFTYAYNILGLQKNFKIIGIFTRLYTQNHLAKYNNYCPMVWQYIKKGLGKNECKDIMHWIKKYNIPV